MTAHLDVTVICGVGALGSHLVQFLRNEKDDIRIVDFDRVEHTNLATQLHGKPNVGKTKVVSLSRTMDFLYGRQLLTNSSKLDSSNVDILLPHAKLVVDCFDNAASRKIVQDFCVAKNIPCLHGALAADGQYGRVVWSEKFVIDSESRAGAPTCEGDQHLPFIALVSAYLASAAQAFLRDGKRTGYAISPAGAFRV
jgi:molybdopterin/thiamine biosynthesis adenylyltransferase